MSAPPPAAGRPALLFVLVTVLLDSMGLGVIIPVMPELVMELTGEGLSRASTYGGWLAFVYALMQLFCAPVVGNLSDAFGRRPVLLLSLMAFGIDYVLMAMAPTLAWLFVGRMVAGATGATYGTASAYIADVTEPEDRAASFGKLGAAWGVGFILGPVIGGLLGDLGPRAPFYGAAGLALVNAAYGLLVLPETLRPEERRPFSLRRASPLGALAQMRRFPAVAGLLVALLFYQIAHNANPSVWSYYTMKKFGWSGREVGYSLGFVGLLIAVVQGGLMRPVIGRLGERRAVQVGLGLMTLGFVGFALSPTAPLMYLSIVPFCLGAFAAPALKGIMSRHIPANSQGELQGAITSMASLTAIVSPPLMTQLFGYFSADAAPVRFPGAPFAAAALLLLLCLAWFQRSLQRARSPQQA